MGLLGFLFGKDPDIFDEKGQVRHKLPEQKWKAWKDRFAANPEFDWRKHMGRTHQPAGSGTKSAATLKPGSSGKG